MAAPEKRSRREERENEEIDSSDEEQNNSDSGANFVFSDEEDVQTPQDKRLRLAKKYLDEIEKEEQTRREDKELYKSVSQRLDEEYLDSVGKLRKKIADDFVGVSDVRVFKHKLHKLPVTCVCLSADNKFLFTGSKTPFVLKWSLAGDGNAKVVASFDCSKARSIAAEESVKSKTKPPRLHVFTLAVSTDLKFLVSGFIFRSLKKMYIFILSCRQWPTQVQWFKFGVLKR